MGVGEKCIMLGRKKIPQNDPVTQERLQSLKVWCIISNPNTQSISNFSGTQFKSTDSVRLAPPNYCQLAMCPVTQIPQQIQNDTN